MITILLLLSILIVIAALIFFVFYVFRNKEIVQTLKNGIREGLKGSGFLFKK